MKETQELKFKQKEKEREREREMSLYFQWGPTVPNYTLCREMLRLEVAYLIYVYSAHPVSLSTDIHAHTD